MALISCPECGKEISDKAAACPNCGCPMEVIKEEHTLNVVEKQNLYDVQKYIEVYGKNKVELCKNVAHEYKLSLSEAKKVVDDYFAGNASKISEREQIKKEENREKALEYKKQGIPFCPLCQSTSVTYVDKKLSIGRALVGNAVAGGVGAILGGQSSKKGKCKCLNCGHSWKI